MYKLTEYGVLNLDKNSYIPNCLANKDWQIYLEWAKTNTAFTQDTGVEKINGIWTDISNTIEYIQKQKEKQIEIISIEWAQLEKKYMDLINKTACCGQTTANTNYKADYQTAKQRFLDQVIAINIGA